MLRGAPPAGALEVTSHWEDTRVDKGLGRFILAAAKENLNYLEESKWPGEKVILGIKGIRKERIM